MTSSPAYRSHHQKQFVDPKPNSRFPPPQVLDKDILDQVRPPAPTIPPHPFLAALAALYLTFVSQSVSQCHL